MSEAVRSLICSLCLEEINDYLDTYKIMSRFSIDCEHKFHLSCFTRYVVTRRLEDSKLLRFRQRSCPVCRHEIMTIHLVDKDVGFQQFLEKCMWKEYKKKYDLESKEGGADLINDYVDDILQGKRLFDIELHNDYGIILSHLRIKIPEAVELAIALKKIIDLDFMGYL